MEQPWCGDRVSFKQVRTTILKKESAKSLWRGAQIEGTIGSRLFSLRTLLDTQRVSTSGRTIRLSGIFPATTMTAHGIRTARSSGQPMAVCLGERSGIQSLIRENAPCWRLCLILPTQTASYQERTMGSTSLVPMPGVRGIRRSSPSGPCASQRTKLWPGGSGLAPTTRASGLQRTVGVVGNN